MRAVVEHVGMTPRILWELWPLSQAGSSLLEKVRSRTHRLGCCPEIRTVSTANAVCSLNTGPLKPPQLSRPVEAEDETLASHAFPCPFENSNPRRRLPFTSFLPSNLARVPLFHEISLTSRTLAAMESGNDL